MYVLMYVVTYVYRTNVLKWRNKSFDLASKSGELFKLRGVMTGAEAFKPTFRFNGGYYLWRESIQKKISY